ncbi:GIN domain-containing protein [Photobacterium angustum]|uniref:GIN domain-containing protein n=1 Tax=Photobacterium angustum TaxID=661 RepID=UPI000D1615B7|nr:DUF2807 domain-containing protein [Photobacterium angustum]PSV93493.1 DUF2807 domain-containing protein [Photobacterium angustum]PSW81584.1 DUF2807 domain-containing protein [Photobacterium angustum]
MRKSPLFLTVLLAVGTLSFSKAMAETVTMHKDIQGVSKIALNSAGDLFIKQGNKDSLRIEIDKALVPELDVSKTWNTLNLNLKHSYNYQPNSVKYYVVLKDITEISTKNSGKVVISSNIKANDLDLNVENSGSISAEKINVSDSTNIALANSGSISVGNLNTNNFQLNLKNSGSININNLNANNLDSSLANSGSINISEGKVNLQTIKLENSGTYKSGVQASHAYIHISGSGSVYADVKDQASVNISGSGDLYLTGSPALKSVSITGSGQIHSM